MILNGSIFKLFERMHIHTELIYEYSEEFMWKEEVESNNIIIIFFFQSLGHARQKNLPAGNPSSTHSKHILRIFYYPASVRGGILIIIISEI